MLKSKTIKQLKVGDKYEIKQLILEKNILDFARVSGDFNPLHIDEGFAKGTIFKKRICHGMYPASLISKVIGMNIPGPGTIYLAQTLKFLAPIYIGDEIKVVVLVERIDYAKKKVYLKTTVLNQHNERVIIGEASVKPPE